VFMLAGPASWETQTDISSNFRIDAVEDVLA